MSHPDSARHTSVDRRAGSPGRATADDAAQRDRIVRAILWDNDGVLVDSEPLYLKASREVLASVGIELSLDQYREISLTRGGSVFELAEQAGMRPARVQELRRRRDRLYAESLRRGVRLREGIAACLARVDGMVRMGIVTSSPREHFEIIHARSGLLRHFEFAVTREDYRRAKPDPEPYRRGLDMLGLAPDECLAIEDTERGLLSARRAGLRCIVFPHALNRGSTFAGAWRVIDQSSELTAELVTLLAVS